MSAEQVTKGRARALNHSTPKWVMVGLEWDGPGVLLMASKRLGRATIDWEAQREYFFRDMEDMRRNFNPSLELKVTIADDKSYVLIAAENYAQAIEALFGGWAPDDESPAALGEGNKQIRGRLAELEAGAG